MVGVVHHMHLGLDFTHHHVPTGHVHHHLPSVMCSQKSSVVSAFPVDGAPKDGILGTGKALSATGPDMTSKSDMTARPLPPDGVTLQGPDMMSKKLPHPGGDPVLNPAAKASVEPTGAKPKTDAPVVPSAAPTYSAKEVKADSGSDPSANKTDIASAQNEKSAGFSKTTAEDKSPESLVKLLKVCWEPCLVFIVFRESRRISESPGVVSRCWREDF